jgi:hypothetical protein
MQSSKLAAEEKARWLKHAMQVTLNTADGCYSCFISRSAAKQK